jgi:hypothetical protein
LAALAALAALDSSNEMPLAHPPSTRLKHNRAINGSADFFFNMIAPVQTKYK